MQIEFGWSLDGAAWADASSAAATGTVRLGPQGLVALLQTRLALTRPAVDPAVRIAQYARALAAADHPWPRASFAVDPWSTARSLLAARDAAVAAGARLAPRADLPARLAALAAAEETLGRGDVPALSPGAADDLRELVDQLEQDPWPTGITALTCHEDPAALPGAWPRLLHALARGGAEITVLPPVDGPPPELVVVEAGDEWTAAETAARLLAGRDADAGPLELLATAGTTLLDQELHRRGLPAVGVAPASADRTALQILPLFLAAVTAPVDVQQLGALLDLRVMDAPEGEAEPVGLVPPRVRRALLDALAQEPAVGGPAWRAALDGIDDERAAEHARALSALITHPLPASGLTPSALRRVTAWLGERLRALGRGDAGLTRAAAHLQVLLAVLDTLQPDTPIGERELLRMVATAGRPAASPLARPEATTAWRTCTRPAQLRGGGDVLWWGADRDDPATGVPWDPAEAEALTALGARVVDPAAVAELVTRAGLRGLRGARRLVVVRTTTRAEKVVAPPPLLAHLAAARATDGEGVAEVLARHTLDPSALVDGGTWTLAGSRRTLEVPAPLPARSPRTDLTRRVAPAPHLLPRRLSFSQAENLLGCRQKWTYSSGLGLRAAAVSTVPTGNRMIGTLVHAVVEHLVEHDQRAEHIDEALDALLPQLASELLLPGREVELERVRATTRRSLTVLFTRLAEAGLAITGVEERFEEPLPLPLRRGEVTVPFMGFRDLVAEDAQGRRMVIDLKWTAAATKYPDLFDTGEALQLAAYAHRVDQEPASDAGYFLLAQGEFVSSNPALDPAGRPTLDVEAVWSRTVGQVTEALDAIRDGEVSAASGQILLDAGQDLGTPRTAAKDTYTRARETARAAGGVVVDARCDYCDFSLLCGLRGEAS